MCKISILIQCTWGKTREYLHNLICEGKLAQTTTEEELPLPKAMQLKESMLEAAQKVWAIGQLLLRLAKAEVTGHPKSTDSAMGLEVNSKSTHIAGYFGQSYMVQPTKESKNPLINPREAPIFGIFLIKKWLTGNA